MEKRLGCSEAFCTRRSKRVFVASNDVSIIEAYTTITANGYPHRSKQICKGEGMKRKDILGERNKIRVCRLCYCKG